MRTEREESGRKRSKMRAGEIQAIKGDNGRGIPSGVFPCFREKSTASLQLSSVAFAIKVWSLGRPLSLSSLAILILLIWSTGLELEGRNSRKGGNGIELGCGGALVHILSLPNCK